jgi:hypothetical protein
MGPEEHALARERTPPSLLIDHVEALQRLGWWTEAERVLLQYKGDSLDPTEADRRLAFIREKKRIYARTDGDRAEGRSYIGENDVVQLVKEPVRLTYHLKDRNLDIEGIFHSLLRIIDLVRKRLSYDPPSVTVALHGPKSEIMIEGHTRDDHRLTPLGGLTTGSSVCVPRACMEASLSDSTSLSPTSMSIRLSRRSALVTAPAGWKKGWPCPFRRNFLNPTRNRSPQLSRRPGRFPWRPLGETSCSTLPRRRPV